MSAVSPETQPFRVLCLDGGGMRGVYQAAFLDTFAARLTESTGRHRPIDVGKAFDLIVGTSTGGIVACALAAGISLDSVRRLYWDHGGHIFPHQLLRSLWVIGRVVRGLGLGLRKGDAALRAVLQNTLGRRTMGEVDLGEVAGGTSVRPVPVGSCPPNDRYWNGVIVSCWPTSEPRVLVCCGQKTGDTNAGWVPGASVAGTSMNGRKASGSSL